MMSAAISMLAGLEQTKAGPSAGDLLSGQGELQDASFAKSLSESVGVPASSKGESAAGDLAIARELKSTTPAPQPEEVAGRSSGVKEESVKTQEMPVHSELKGAVAGTIVPQQATTVTGAQEKMTASGTGTAKVDVAAQVERTTDDVSTESPVARATLGSGAKNGSPVLHVGIADGDQPLAPLVLSGDSPVVQKETATAEKVTEDVALKKSIKAQENSGTPKTGQKTVGKIVDATAVEPKPVMGTSAETAIPVAGQAVAPTVTVQSEIGKATDVFSKAVSPVTKPSTGTSPVAVDGPVRKEVASGVKASVTDTGITATAGSDPVASAKTDVGPEKIPAVAIRVGSDGENKPQAVPESGAALLHSIGIVPAAVAPGNIPGELAATPVGNAGAHMGGLPAGSREQDGAGVVGQSMDGAPRMLAATPTSLEVGIQNGTQGWLKVRAEMTDGGVVNASVSAASSAGQEMLHRELPALTAYLQQEKVAVNAVTVHASTSAGSDARSSSGTDGAGGQTPQRSSEGGQQHQGFRKTALDGSDETMTYRSLHGVDEDGSLPLVAYTNGGNWLSVRA